LQFVLVPADSPLPLGVFHAVFAGDPRYRFDLGDPHVARYTNPATDAYFQFAWTPAEDDYPCGAVHLSVEVPRPPGFAEEAAREADRVATALRLLAVDDEGDAVAFTSEAIVEAFAMENVGAYAELVRTEPERKLFALARRRLDEVWAWNESRLRVAAHAGPSVQVPFVRFLAWNGEVGTVTAIDERSAVLLPRADFVALTRGAQTSFVAWEEMTRAIPALLEAPRGEPAPHWWLPSQVAERFESLWAHGRAARGEPMPVQAEQVHALEDVEAGRLYASSQLADEEDDEEDDGIVDFDDLLDRARELETFEEHGEDWFCLIWRWSDTPRTQRVRITAFERGDDAWISLVSYVCKADQADPSDLLRRNSELQIGTFAIDGDYCVLVYNVPIDVLSWAWFVEMVGGVACDADDLEDELTGNADDY
jgi:hypothetical protein